MNAATAHVKCRHRVRVNASGSSEDVTGMREDIAGVPSPDDAPQQSLTIEEVLAQLDRVGCTPPRSELDFDREGLARLRAWMRSDDPLMAVAPVPGT